MNDDSSLHILPEINICSDNVKAKNRNIEENNTEKVQQKKGKISKVNFEKNKIQVNIVENKVNLENVKKREKKEKN